MLKAVLFDLDGVIIDTERHGHRVAFNDAFIRLGYPDVVWDEELYHQLLQVGGGKERIRHYFEQHYAGQNPPADVAAFAAEAHRCKTSLFVERLPRLPLRPGVRRFMSEVRDSGVPIGICTTSNERVAATVRDVILPDIPFTIVIAGDMVTRKKPDPEIYTMALRQLGVSPAEALVVEDSAIGVQAGKAAGCTVLATYNGYTEQEDLSPADFIVSSLGDIDGEKTIVRKERFPIAPAGYVSAATVARGLASASV